MAESADIVQVAKAVKSLRDQAEALRNAHYSDTSRIQEDAKLSDQGKVELIGELTRDYQQEMTSLMNQEKTIIASKVQDLETRLLGMDGGRTGADMIALRDAQDRAEALESADDAARRAEPLMRRALRSQDHTLSYALFRAAVENGWRSAAQIFAAENPEIATVVSDIDKLTGAHLSFSRAAAYIA